jgi:hypothetical protein
LSRLSRHILSQLVCLGRHTLTNLLTTEGRQYLDWTADYRLYSQQRIDCSRVFSQIRQEVQALTPAKQALITALDDSLLRKTAKKSRGQYARDPKDPPFS